MCAWEGCAHTTSLLLGFSPPLPTLCWALCWAQRIQGEDVRPPLPWALGTRPLVQGWGRGVQPVLESTYLIGPSPGQDPVLSAAVRGTRAKSIREQGPSGVTVSVTFTHLHGCRVRRVGTLWEGKD